MFIYEEGLVRLCTRDYARPSTANLGDEFMHLTNYAINKRNTAAYVKAESATGVGGSGCTGAMAEAKRVQLRASCPCLCTRRILAGLHNAIVGSWLGPICIVPQLIEGAGRW